MSESFESSGDISSDVGGDMNSDVGSDTSGDVGLDYGGDLAGDTGADLNGNVGKRVDGGMDAGTGTNKLIGDDLNGFPPNDGYADAPTSTDWHFGDTGLRYGSPDGRYATNIGTSPEQCSLPPGNDRTPHPFIVLGDISNVQAGTAAPAYGQEGGGKQYTLPDTLENLNDPSKNPQNARGKQ